MVKRRKGKKDESTRSGLQELKAEVAKQKSQTKMLLIGATIIIIAIGIVVSANLLIRIENGDEIKIPLSEVDDGEIYYYTVEDVTFYVHKNSQGNIHTRISFCEPCVGKKFTVLEGGTIIDCDECHTRWDSETYEGIYPEPGEVRAGVNITTEEIGCENYPPAYLPSTVKEGYVIIQKTDLTA